MATSGTYVTEVPLKGTVEKHYKKWRSENHAFPEAIGHHIQNVIIHDGEWDSHGAIKTWNYTCDGKPEVFKERREIDDEKKTVTFRGLEGHVMEQLKVYDVTLEFIPKSEDGCLMCFFKTLTFDRKQFETYYVFSFCRQNFFSEMAFSGLSRGLLKSSFTMHYINPLPKLVAGMSSVIEVKPKKHDDKEKSGAGVKEASWIDLYLPEEARGYAKLARLDKPIGTWLFAWSYMWSIALAADPGSLPSFEMMALFGCKALVLRGPACTINDLFDRDIDRKVERTRLRPLASGLFTPFQGIQFLGLQLLLLLGILLQLNNYSRVLGALSLLLNFSYPLMTRFTHWPQAFLAVCWTIVYDTIYAHQDKEDDLKVGVNSSYIW
ncbi:hypothetical protein HID58_030153 [Brassica napus]|uniref:Bet v I/Major latex protein domain-containing protein n=1 Tax=Brassica napus TaxID=3708 RepID=A0ABQ8CF40_BRANA|nr:hypothetical protein HID58_030153 [Brassica napus]